MEACRPRQLMSTKQTVVFNVRPKLLERSARSNSVMDTARALSPITPIIMNAPKYQLPEWIDTMAEMRRLMEIEQMTVNKRLMR
jgi:hypothetical protein